jgi:hypothetical protein
MFRLVTEHQVGFITRIYLSSLIHAKNENIDLPAKLSKSEYFLFYLHRENFNSCKGRYKSERM